MTTRDAPGRSGPVLQLATRLNIGGVAGHVLLLARALSAERPVTVAAGRPTAGEGELTDEEVQVRPVPLVREVRPWTDLRAFMAVRGILAETKATVLHTHMAKAGTVGRVAARTLAHRPRTVHTFHGHVLDSYFSAPVQRAFVEVERRLATRTDALVAVSTEIRDDLLALGIGRPSQFHVVPYGLDLNRLLAVGGQSGTLRGPLGLGADVPLVGILARLVPIKDHATLFAALALLPEVHLAVLGDGELRPELQGAVERMGLKQRVHFTGWCADVPAAIADIDVIALSSRNEGTPMALIEAGAAGRPVVATAVGGVSTVVVDGVTGSLCPPADSAALARSLGDLLSDRSKRERMGAAARRSVQVRYGQERLLSDIRDLYASLG